MPSKRKRGGPGFDRDAPADSSAAFKRSKPAYNQVYRLPSRNISGPGIFVTCVQSKERKAALQFIDLLNEVADRIYPGVAPQPLPEVEEKKEAPAAEADVEDMDALRNGAVAERGEKQPQPVEEKAEEKKEEAPKKGEAEEDDIAAQIAAELKDIKSSERSRGPSKKGKSSAGPTPRFRSVETDTECFLFISVSPPFDPYLLVYTILSDVELSGEPRSRFVQRLTPVTTTCAANAADLSTLARTVLPTFFSTDPAEAKTFKIDPRIRSHSKLKRNDVIQTIAAAIPTDSDGARIHNANLNAPDYWIVAEVVKNSAAISVLKDYERYKKMNLQSVALAANEKKAQLGAEGGEEKGRIAASLVGKSEAKEEPATEKGDEEAAPQPAETETAAPTTTETAAEQNDEQQMANFRLF
ncbi:related to TAN1-putative tRNA acetyltransferase [Sporisorium reilianum f. sp. reilianum]|uniref:Related to TAN1-putative tRNA acetyltransferase n=1 Tax=Sporisorium reilianum f. sp. reilianum TaxID=72559 RepID=A0A2N8UFI1_9BASI|nr:related to TAN1-putative tRNA acetyltransferase [Sporisorium reilianum f. sp. reilianum]